MRILQSVLFLGITLASVLNEYHTHVYSENGLMKCSLEQKRDSLLICMRKFEQTKFLDFFVNLFSHKRQSIVIHSLFALDTFSSKRINEFNVILFLENEDSTSMPPNMSNFIQWMPVQAVSELIIRNLTSNQILLLSILFRDQSSLRSLEMSFSANPSHEKAEVISTVNSFSDLLKSFRTKFERVSIHVDVPQSTFFELDSVLDEFGNLSEYLKCDVIGLEDFTPWFGSYSFTQLDILCEK